MKKIIIVFAMIGSVVMVLWFFTFIRPVSPDPKNPRVSALLRDWTRAKEYTQAYLDASNEVMLSFKPLPEMRTFREQMLHLSEANYNLGAAAQKVETPVKEFQYEKSGQFNTKAELRSVVLDSYDFVINGIKQFSDSRLRDTTSAFGFKMTIEDTIDKAFEHQTHQRGQTTVYLRLSGINPPKERLFK